MEKGYESSDSDPDPPHWPQVKKTYKGHIIQDARSNTETETFQHVK